jgi:hypothetical protein
MGIPGPIGLSLSYVIAPSNPTMRAMTWNCYDSSAQYATLLIFNLIRPIGFPGASEKFCTRAPPAWCPQWSSACTPVRCLDIKVLVAIDMARGRPGRPDRGESTGLHGGACLLQWLHHSRHGDRMPADAGMRHEIPTERLRGEGRPATLAAWPWGGHHEQGPQGVQGLARVQRPEHAAPILSIHLPS